MKHCEEYKSQLLMESREIFGTVSGKLTELEMAEAGSLAEVSGWATELESEVKDYISKRDNIKYCFKLLEIQKLNDLKGCEREYTEKLRAFKENFDRNLLDHLEVIRFEERDVLEVEKMAQIVSNAGEKCTERPRRRSMLPSKIKTHTETIGLIKVKEQEFTGMPTAQEERSLFSAHQRNMLPSISKSPARQRKSVTPQMGILPAQGVQANHEALQINFQSLREEMLGKEFRMLEDIDPNDTLLKIRANLPERLSVRTNIQKTAQIRDSSPAEKKPLGIAFDDDVYLLSSGIFDNGRGLNEQIERETATKKMTPRLGKELGSFYESERALKISPKFPDKLQVNSVFQTPSKGRSIGKSTAQATPETVGLKSREESSRFLGITPLTSNRLMTPNKLAKSRDKNWKVKEFFENEPLKSIMKTLEADGLPSITLKGARLTDEHVFELCGRILQKSMLKTVDLSNNRITDKGLMRICEVLPKTNVVTLIMSFNEISNEGLKHCFNMIKTPGNKVKFVAIDPCKIEKTEEGRRQILDAFMKKGVALKF